MFGRGRCFEKVIMMFNSMENKSNLLNKEETSIYQSDLLPGLLEILIKTISIRWTKLDCSINLYLKSYTLFKRATIFLSACVIKTD